MPVQGSFLLTHNSQILLLRRNEAFAQINLLLCKVKITGILCFFATNNTEGEAVKKRLCI